MKKENFNSLAYQEHNRIRYLSAFNVAHSPVRRKLNQHATLYMFNDGSKLRICHNKGYSTCYTDMGTPQAEGKLTINQRG